MTPDFPLPATPARAPEAPELALTKTGRPGLDCLRIDATSLDTTHLSSELQLARFVVHTTLAGQPGTEIAARTGAILEAVNTMEQQTNVVPFWASIR